MSKFFRSKVFIGAFLLSYFLFFLLTAFLPFPGIGVGNTEYGFPFTYYYSHCYGGGYSWSGLIGNCLAAASFSIVIGLVSTYVWLNNLIPFWQKINSPEFRAKWYL